MLARPGRQRRADDCDLSDAPFPIGLAPLHEDAVRSPQPDRHDRHLGHLQRETRRTRLAAHGLEVERNRSFRKHRDAFTGVQRVDRRAERVGCVGLAALDRDLMRGSQERAESGLGEQFRFCEKAHSPPPSIRDVGEGQRVEVGDVVAGKNERSALRKVGRAFDGPVQRVTQAVARTRLWRPNRRRPRLGSIRSSWRNGPRATAPTRQSSIPLRSFADAKVRLGVRARCRRACRVRSQHGRDRRCRRGHPSGRHRLECTRGTCVGGGPARSPCSTIRDRSTARPQPATSGDAQSASRAGRRRARGPSARSHARRGRFRWQRSGCGRGARPSRRRHPGAGPSRRNGVHLRVRTGLRRSAHRRS